MIAPKDLRILSISDDAFTCYSREWLLKMLSLNSSKAMGPDGVPGWLLKDNADLFAQPVADILNCSFQEARLPSSWKDADITPVPKEKPIRYVNKHLRPISLTPVLSKLAEDYVVEQYVKPAVLGWMRISLVLCRGRIPRSPSLVCCIHGSAIRTEMEQLYGPSSLISVRPST